MRAVLEQGLKETSILNPSNINLIPLLITGFLVIVISQYIAKV